MTRRLISTGSPFEKIAGYSRAVVQGDWCFVSGTTGYDYATMTMPETINAAPNTMMNEISIPRLQSRNRPPRPGISLKCG